MLEDQQNQCKDQLQLEDRRDPDLIQRVFDDGLLWEFLF